MFRLLCFCLQFFHCERIFGLVRKMNGANVVNEIVVKGRNCSISVLRKIKKKKKHWRNVGILYIWKIGEKVKKKKFQSSANIENLAAKVRTRNLKLGTKMQLFNINLLVKFHVIRCRGSIIKIRFIISNFTDFQTGPL